MTAFLRFRQNVLLLIKVAKISQAVLREMWRPFQTSLNREKMKLQRERVQQNIDLLQSRQGSTRLFSADDVRLILTAASDGKIDLLDYFTVEDFQTLLAVLRDLKNHDPKKAGAIMDEAVTKIREKNRSANNTFAEKIRAAEETYTRQGADGYVFVDDKFFAACAAEKAAVEKAIEGLEHEIHTLNQQNRIADVVTGSNVTRLYPSSFVPYPDGFATGFHSPPSLYNACQPLGTRHDPVPVSSNQYTSTPETFAGALKSYCTHSVVPL